jgi:hypothetical protein
MERKKDIQTQATTNLLHPNIHIQHTSQNTNKICVHKTLIDVQLPQIHNKYYLGKRILITLPIGDVCIVSNCHS